MKNLHLPSYLLGVLALFISCIVSSLICGALSIRDENARIAAEDYEHCVMVEYGIMPGDYYQQFDYYPSCK